jgi:hypothetical protein
LFRDFGVQLFLDLRPDFCRGSFHAAELLEQLLLPGFEMHGFLLELLDALFFGVLGYLLDDLIRKVSLFFAGLVRPSLDFFYSAKKVFTV